MNHRFWFSFVFSCLDILFFCEEGKQAENLWDQLEVICRRGFRSGISKISHFEWRQIKCFVASRKCIRKEIELKVKIFNDKKLVLIDDDLSLFFSPAAAKSHWALSKWKIIGIDKLWAITIDFGSENQLWLNNLHFLLEATQRNLAIFLLVTWTFEIL